MHLIDPQNAADYLRQRGWVQQGERLEIAELAGGVSNQVLYVGRPDAPGGDFVLKQARPQLRVPDAWFCGVDRIWREVAVLRICQRLLREPSVDASTDWTIVTPAVLHEDRENFAFAMTAAPRDHRVWKSDLLAGRIETSIAAACGRLMATLHTGTWHDPQIAAELDDRQVYDELRLDPYYRTVARGEPAAAPWFERLCDSVWRQRHALVHADFSPKNLLVYSGGLMLLDFETGHYGDPAFDLGFFLSHLVLKATRAAPAPQPLLQLVECFAAEYDRRMLPRIGRGEWIELWRRGVQNLAGCAWARLDGKSRVDYLVDLSCRDALRDWCRHVLSDPQLDRPAALSSLAAMLAA